MLSYEGLLTLSVRMRVSPNPVERIPVQWGISDHSDCPADGKCKPEQIRGACEPLKRTFPF